MAGAHQGGGVVDQQSGIVRLEAERGLVIALGLREVAVIGLVLAGEKVRGGREFGIGGLCDAGEGIGIDLTVVDDFFGHIGFVVERGRGRSDIGDLGGSSGTVNGRGATSVDALDGRFGDGVGVVAEVVLDAIFVLAFADLVGPDGASILEMNDVGGRGRAPREALE